MACTHAGSPHGRPRQTHRRTPASSASDKRAFTSRDQLAGRATGQAASLGSAERARRCANPLHGHRSALPASFARTALASTYRQRIRK